MFRQRTRDEMGARCLFSVIVLVHKMPFSLFNLSIKIKNYNGWKENVKRESEQIWFQTRQNNQITSVTVGFDHHSEPSWNLCTFTFTISKLTTPLVNSVMWLFMGCLFMAVNGAQRIQTQDMVEPW